MSVGKFLSDCLYWKYTHCRHYVILFFAYTSEGKNNSKYYVKGLFIFFYLLYMLKEHWSNATVKQLGKFTLENDGIEPRTFNSVDLSFSISVKATHFTCKVYVKCI